jgi:hypothetical protein
VVSVVVSVLCHILGVGTVLIVVLVCCTTMGCARLLVLSRLLFLFLFREFSVLSLVYFCIALFSNLHLHSTVLAVPLLVCLAVVRGPRFQ